MSEIRKAIRDAQVQAGEQVVIEHLRRQGLLKGTVELGREVVDAAAIAWAIDALDTLAQTNSTFEQGEIWIQLEQATQAIRAAYRNAQAAVESSLQHPTGWIDTAATRIETWLFENSCPIVKEQREEIALIIADESLAVRAEVESLRAEIASQEQHSKSQE